MENKQFIRDFIVFGIVGAIATAVDVGSYGLMYRILSVNIYLSVAVGFFLGTVVGYLINNAWTYGRNESRPNIPAFVKSVAIAAVALGLTEVIVHILTVRIDIGWLAPKLVAVFIVFFWNFFANRLWVFGAPKQTL